MARSLVLTCCCLVQLQFAIVEEGMRSTSWGKGELNAYEPVRPQSSSSNTFLSVHALSLSLSLSLCLSVSLHLTSKSCG